MTCSSVGRLTLVLCLQAAAIGGCSGHSAVALTAIEPIARNWHQNYTVTGLKTEPTYVEDITYGRWGNRFAVRASVNGSLLGYTEIWLGSSGEASVQRCSAGLKCRPFPPSGYLVTVSVLAASYRHYLHSVGRVFSYRGRKIICLESPVPGVQVSKVGSPCFDSETGAYIAERSGKGFGGPMVDSWSLRLSLRPEPSLFRSAK